MIYVSATLTPTTPAELAEAVRSQPHVLAVGARTKPRLSQVPDEVVLLCTRALRGIFEYEPDEFTFTALAGTSVREIGQALAEKGQYLPFDPMWLEAGATLGGTVAAGVSGPGRFRFGGVRDFILGVRFVDGQGRLLRMGGKVVKNCAGFDLPKFFVGSLGRYGVLAEVTFKVFPSPASRLTLKLTTSGAEAAAKVLMDAANSRWTSCSSFSRSRNASTTSGSNCVPDCAKISSRAAVQRSDRRYGLSLVMASRVSATANTRAPTGIFGPATPSG